MEIRWHHATTIVFIITVREFFHAVPSPELLIVTDLDPTKFTSNIAASTSSWYPNMHNTCDYDNNVWISVMDTG